MQPTDEALVAAVRRGDLSSFALLYERHYRMAVGIARARLSDWHLAEDAAQEAFAVACRTLPTLRDPARFAEWLGTICRRAASRLHEARPAHEPLAEEPGKVDDFDKHALRIQVQEALVRLDATTREVVVLRYFSNLSYDDIGRALGLTVPSVHGRLQRARARLATLLQAEAHPQE